MDKLPHDAGFRYPEPQLQVDSLPVKELIDQLFGIIRRQYPLIAVISACVIAFALVYLFTTPKLYTAHAQFLIDTTKMQILRQQQQVVGETPLDAAQVETEIEVLKSDRVGLSVVKALKLTDDPEFVGSQTSFIGAIFGLVFSPFSSGAGHGAMSEDALTASALGRVLSHRNIARVGETYVLDISYTSLNPGRAAEVANGIADAYLTDKLDAKFESSRRARKWLEERVADMRLQAMAADRAVLEFKEQKGIIDTGSRGTDNGRLLVDQRVDDLNSQLAKARAATAEAKARLDQIQVVMTQEIPDAAVADSLSNSIISSLRTQYLDYDRRYQLYAARYGPTHLAVINLQTQMAELRRSMTAELNRIAESYKSSYAIAKAAEESLQGSLAQQVAGAQLTNRERLGLDELESKAKVYHSAHDGFLQQFMEITQQQSLPITEARVISAATPPGGASSPRTSRILFLTCAFGLMLGFAAAYLRDTIDNVFRTPKQVKQILKTNCLTILPIVKKAVLSDPAAQGTQNSASKSGGSVREIRRDIVGPYRHVVDEPLSAFAEGVRAVKVATDISRSIKQNKVIGITSSLPSEGKSVVATNFAEIIAQGGNKVILIDGDLRNPTLTRRLVSKPDVGLLQVIGGKCELRQAIHFDRQTGLAFLPAVIESRLAHSSEILASEAFGQLIDRLRETFDYIVIDFPPLAPVVDVRATTNIVDSYVFVVEWGRTRIKMVQRQLDSAPEICDRLLGVVLNKADTKVLNRYEDYYGSYYYKKDYYAAYGYTA